MERVRVPPTMADSARRPNGFGRIQRHPTAFAEFCCDRSVAAAATLGCELTVPEVAQSVVLTRVSGRASAMPPHEQLASFAATP